MKIPIIICVVLLTLCPVAHADSSRDADGNDPEYIRASQAVMVQDYKTAIPMLISLTKNGNTLAQITLGAMYENGLGVPGDYVQADLLYIIAGSRQPQTGLINNQQALGMQQNVERHMLPQQLEQAHAGAQAWLQAWHASHPE